MKRLLYAVTYHVQAFWGALLANDPFVCHESFRGMVDLQDRELVNSVHNQTAGDVCLDQIPCSCHRVIIYDSTVHMQEHFRTTKSPPCPAWVRSIRLYVITIPNT